MSNCVQLHKHVVNFTADEIDIDRFAQMLEEHKDHPRTPPVEDIFCWFLRDNSMVKDGVLTIRFGEGRSTHCWRDLAHTIWLLNPLIRKQKIHTFLIADESDGFDSVGSVTVSWPHGSIEQLRKVI